MLLIIYFKEGFSLKAKLKTGLDLVTQTTFEVVDNELIITLMEKYIFLSFLHYRNHLLINTTMGKIDIVFTSEEPKEIILSGQEKNQLYFTVR